MIIYPQAPRNILWFTIAMAVALITYAIARNQLWTTHANCESDTKFKDLDGEAYLLNRQINACRQEFGAKNDRTSSDWNSRLLECERLEK